LELDSVYQLQKYTREFYEKKSKLSRELVQTLDALLNDRPVALQAKRKHFDVEEGVSGAPKREKLEQMRINTERDRVRKFREIIRTQAQLYFNILEEFAKMLELRKV
jgi:hypothetical protein